MIFRKHCSDGVLFKSFEEFFEAILSYQEQQRVTLRHHHVPPLQAISSAQRSRQPVPMATLDSSISLGLRSTGQSEFCGICFENRANVILKPCGHLACYSCCSRVELRRCPVCCQIIREKMRAFRSQVF